MSLSLSSKRLCQCVYRPCRQFSSSAPSSSRSKRRSERSQEAERKRHLISIYHKADTFITLENLSSHIDKEFARFKEDSVSVTRQEYRGNDLVAELKDWQQLPRFTTRNAAFLSSTKSDGVNFKNEKEPLSTDADRHFRLRAALQGADASMKIGLEGVEEYAKRTRGIHAAMRSGEDGLVKESQ